MTMWTILIVLLGLVCTVPGAPVSLCPKSCSCTTTGIYLKAHCKSLDFLNKPLSPEQTNSIVELDVSNSSVIKISANLPILRHLKHLKLASNKIQHFTATSLPKSLEYLDLSHNSIKYLPQDLKLLPSLKEVHLFKNPISCKCDSLSVRDSLLKNGVSVVKPPKCEFPEEYRGKSWLSVMCNEDGDVENSFEDMLGDAPYEGSGSGDLNLITESEPRENSGQYSLIDDEFIGVDQSSKAEVTTAAQPSQSTEAPELEGSGDGDETETTTSEFSIFPDSQETTTKAAEVKEDDDDDDEDYNEDYDDVFSEATTVTEPPMVTIDVSKLEADIKACNFNCSTPTPIDIEGNDTAPAPGLFEGIRILAKDLNIIGETETTTTTTENPITVAKVPEEVPVIQRGKPAEVDKNITADAEIIQKELDTDKEAGNIKEDPNKPQESNSTFIFLSVLLLVILCLIIYAIVKKRKMRRNRQASATDKDNEKEALPEEIELLKKPVSQIDKPNGTHETIPLMNGHNENQNKNADEIVPSDTNNEMKPTENGDDVELRPKKPEQILLTPETKRVTIKASEIPNSTPKTPILVTRHKNSDGSIVTTPNIDQHVQ